MVIRNDNTMLNVEEVARILNVHINTVRRWSNNGIIKTYRIGPRGDRRYQYDDVTRFLEEQRSN
ncbi:MAG TPA: helix-turn-helix domain-containing protein [Dehalococcoidia bacterium]|nr:helix-turn-helix domain-containing protein [Dehalococcoidia bacterium]